MAEKKSEKKLLALLLVLVVLSLVVDLLSLNVLYSISNAASSSSANGELASYAYEYEDKRPPGPYCLATCSECKSLCETEQCRIDCVGGKETRNGQAISCDKYCRGKA